MVNSPAAQVAVRLSFRPVAPAAGLPASIADPFGGNVTLSWNAPTQGRAIAGDAVFRYEGTTDPPGDLRAHRTTVRIQK